MNKTQIKINLGCVWGICFVCDDKQINLGDECVMKKFFNAFVPKLTKETRCGKLNGPEFIIETKSSSKLVAKIMLLKIKYPDINIEVTSYDEDPINSDSSSN